MKAPFSSYLTGILPGLQQLREALEASFPYVSILATDSVGFSMQANQKSRQIRGNTMMTERGICIRVQKDGLYSEYALNEFDPEAAEEAAAKIKAAIEKERALLRDLKSAVYETEALSDEPARLFIEMETGELPEEADLGALMESLTAISDAACRKGAHIINCTVTAQSTHVSKLFLTKHRDLRQSYVFSELSLMPLGVNEKKSVMMYDGISGRKGPELFSEASSLIDGAVRDAEEMLSADRVEPGEYEIITTPEVTGLIAHEAFGHGVEMDMFVKKRALGAAYIGKRVGSDLVSMHEGASCVVDVASFAFDDEGTLAGDVTEIDHGILKTGICDALSAKRLGTKPTGNGKRQNFEHKVYTRMTNTMFDSGESTAEEMIATVKHGYLLEGVESGMEDPKHWGIQCLISRGREIRDGKLTGRVVSPVILTGYVPDVLGNISMISKDRCSFGNGGCGKGYKEWVKVSDGGPYLKTRARLG